MTKPKLASTELNLFSPHNDNDNDDYQEWNFHCEFERSGRCN